VSEPKLEYSKYRDYTYEKLIQKHKEPKSDYIYTIDTNFIESNLELGNWPDLPYWMYFSREELENGVQIRKLIWEKRFNIKLIVWLKEANEQWITFESKEYNSKRIAF
jgi:hypothetical protein